MKACNQCGKCCIKYSEGGLSATADEINYWELFRPKIARYVSDDIIWVDPISGKQLSICPWLRKAEGKEQYSCDIYYDRPDDCKVYPVNIEQMVMDECEMLDPEDIADQKLGNTRLKVIMSDSWSSLPEQ